MSDGYQSIVDIEASEDEAPPLALAVLKWLQSEGIVSLESSDCVLGEGYGYAPGPKYQKAVGKLDPMLLQLQINGLKVIPKRTVFDAGGAGFSLECPTCSTAFDEVAGWGDSVGEWFEQSGTALLQCPKCHASNPVLKWKHDPKYAFGNLGFEFWNWLPFTDTFIEQVRSRLGHRIVIVNGCL